MSITVGLHVTVKLTHSTKDLKKEKNRETEAVYRDRVHVEYFQTWVLVVHMKTLSQLYNVHIPPPSPSIVLIAYAFSCSLYGLPFLLPLQYFRIACEPVVCA